MTNYIFKLKKNNIFLKFDTELSFGGGEFSTTKNEPLTRVKSLRIFKLSYQAFSADLASIYLVHQIVPKNIL